MESKRVKLDKKNANDLKHELVVLFKVGKDQLSTLLSSSQKIFDIDEFNIHDIPQIKEKVSLFSGLYLILTLIEDWKKSFSNERIKDVYQGMLECLIEHCQVLIRSNGIDRISSTVFFPEEKSLISFFGEIIRYVIEIVAELDMEFKQWIVMTTTEISKDELLTMMLFRNVYMIRLYDLHPSQISWGIHYVSSMLKDSIDNKSKTMDMDQQLLEVFLEKRNALEKKMSLSFETKTNLRVILQKIPSLKELLN